MRYQHRPARPADNAGRLRLGMVMAAAAALVLTACGAADLAQVNGVAITEDDLVGFDSVYAEPANMNGDQLRQDLSNLVVLEVLATSAATQYDIDVGTADVEAFVAAPPAELEAAVAQLTADVENGTISQGFADATVRSFLLRQEIADRLIVDETQDLVALWEQSPAQLTSGCIRHIVVATEEEALAARERVAGGEAMADVATEVSLDPVPGGLLINQQTSDCEINFGSLIVSAPEFVAAAIELPLDELSEVFQTDFGWHFLRVESRAGPTSAAEIEADPVAFAPQGFVDQLFAAWFNEAMLSAEIEVDRVLGEWRDEQSAIVPFSS